MRAKIVLSFIIDVLILFCVFIFIDSLICDNLQYTILYFIMELFLMYIPIIILSDIIFKGQSLGKKILKVKIISDDNTYLSKFGILKNDLFLFIFPIDFIVILIKKKSIGNIVFKTKYIDTSDADMVKSIKNREKSTNKTKKNSVEKFIIYSIVMYLCCFLYYFFCYDLGDKIFFTYYFFLPILFIVFFIKIIKSSYKLFKNTKNKYYLVPIFILLISVIISFLPIQDLKWNIKFHIYDNEYNKVINNINDNIYKSNEYNNILLPAKYKHLSKNGRVNKYKTDNGNILIRFRISNIYSNSLIYVSNDNATTIKDYFVNVDKINKKRNNWYYVID